MSARLLTYNDALHIAQRLRAIDVRECAEQSYATRPEDIAALCMSEINAKWVICAADGEPVAMFGVSHLHHGLGEAWLLATDRWGEVWQSCTKFAVFLRRNLKLRRIQVHSAAFHRDSHAWLRLLGFEQEAVLRNYGITGEDFYLMALMPQKGI